MKISIVILLVVATAVASEARRQRVKSNRGNEQARLIRSLLSDYDTDARPVKTLSSNMTVNMGLSLQRIEDFNNDTGVITLNMWMTITWKDEFLTWTTRECEVKSLRLQPERIWKPDLLQYDMIDGPAKVVNTNAVVTRDGYVMWVPPVFLKSQCHQNGSNYNCTMKFGSWTYSGEQIDLRSSNSMIDLSSYSPNPRFEVIDTYAKREAKQYDCCPEKYIDITYGIILRKKAK